MSFLLSKAIARQFSSDFNTLKSVVHYAAQIFARSKNPNQDSQLFSLFLEAWRVVNLFICCVWIQLQQ